MTEFDEWKEKIQPDEFNQMLEFIDKCKQGHKIVNKLLFLHGDMHKGVKLAIDIENSIGIDECEYIQFSELFESNVHAVNYNQNKNQNNFAFEKKFYNISNKKCLIIENDILHYEDRFGLIKNFVGDDIFYVFDEQNDNIFTIKKWNFNIIFIAKRISKESAIEKRSIFINL